MFTKIVDRLRKRKVLSLAMELGCDFDGDLIVYKKSLYYVDMCNGIVSRIDTTY